MLVGAGTINEEAVAPEILLNDEPLFVLNCHWYESEAGPEEVVGTVKIASVPVQTVWLPTMADVTLFT